uniref:Fatty acid desaturase domain-containing protein n=1 Tax=Ditylum brightwellii TaxID=49249 RepID=A0A7S4RYW9_9STRA
MCKQEPTAAYDTSKLAKDEQWIEKFDLAAFTADVKRLGDELEKNQGEEDVRHLRKMVLWSNMCGIIGFLTMGFGVNPVAIIGLSTFTFTRWTMIAHHTCHGGYDKCHPYKNKWNRFKFAIGSFWRRFNDWFDWMMPEAWNVEHNNRHHYNLSEIEDPDLVENNLVDLREAPVPVIVKYLFVLINVVTWKWFYYAPNTYKELKLARLRRQNQPIPEGVEPSDAVTIRTVLTSGSPFYSAWELFSVVLGPYLLIHFFLTPLPLMFIGDYFGIENMYWSAVKNLAFAELLTNAHGFVAVVTNHAGDDMYRFREGCRPFSGSFYLRQVLASVDFAMGTDLVDFLHGFLNYQIEHHLWPSLSMRSYQKAAPLVREICAKHGVPYVKENVFWRVKKTVDIMVGTSSMKWFPESYEKKYLEIDAIAEAKKRAAK